MKWTRVMPGEYVADTAIGRYESYQTVLDCNAPWCNHAHKGWELLHGAWRIGTLYRTLAEAKAKAERHFAEETA